MSEEMYNNLIGLRELLSKRRYNFSMIGKYEMIFFNTDSSGGCGCKMPAIVSRLKELLNNNIKKIEEYENKEK